MADDRIGRGVIELVADARKLRAGIEEAKRSIKELGENQRGVSKSAAASIQDYIGKLQQQNAVFGKTVRETELFKLAQKGASDAQLRAADAALRIAERNRKVTESLRDMRSEAERLGRRLGIALTVGVTAAVVAFQKLINSAARFQDISEQTGDSAENIASLAVAAAGGGTDVETLAAAAQRLARSLVDVDEEGNDARAALKSIGIDAQQFKSLNLADQYKLIAEQLNKYQDGLSKIAVAQALFGKSGGQLLPFFKELEVGSGRQIILTQELIQRADEYGDKQSVLAKQLELHAQAIAIDMLPALNDFTGALSDVISTLFDAGKAADEFGRNKAALEFGETIAKVAAFVLDSVDGIVRAFQLVGKTIGGTVAVISLALQGEFRAAVNAAVEAGKDLHEILDRNTFQGTLDARLSGRRADEERRRNFVGPPEPPAGRARPKINFTGGQKPKTDNSAEQLAKAQLDAQLDAIRRASEQQVAAFDRSEKILEARKAANLVADKEYYDAKRTLIEATAESQARAVEEEIALLEKQTFTGKNAAKERVDNERKIADAQSKALKIRQDAATETEVLSIREAAANRAVAQSLEDARQSALAYIDTLQRRNAAELAGIGQGNRFREEQQGRLEAEQRFLQERRKLEGELRRDQITRPVFEQYLAVAAQTYQQEIALYEERTRAIREAEGNWINGAREALSNYADDARNVAKQTEEIFTNAFRKAEDVLTEILDTGKLNFKSLKDAALSVLSDINRSLVRQALGSLADQLKDSDFLRSLGPLLGIGGGSTVPGIAGPIDLKKLSGEAGVDAAGAALQASVTASGAEFSASVTASSAELSTSLAASGAELSASLTAASAGFAPEILAAGTSFAASVSAAGAEFAASVASASAGSGGGGVAGLAGGALSAFSSSGSSEVLGSFAEGINYVPRTGVYQLHQGERVVPSSQNSAGANARPILIQPIFNGPQDQRSVSSGLAAGARMAQRELSRGTA